MNFPKEKKPYHVLIVEKLFNAVKTTIEQPTTSQIMSQVVHTCITLLAGGKLPGKIEDMRWVSNRVQDCALMGTGSNQLNPYGIELGELWEHINAQIHTEVEEQDRLEEDHPITAT